MDQDLFTVTVGIIIVACARLWFKHRERTIELQNVEPNRVAQNSGADMVALRDELNCLRDTTTQYDISVERAMQDMQHRLAALEERAFLPSPSRTSPLPSASPQPAEQIFAKPPFVKICAEFATWPVIVCP